MGPGPVPEGCVCIGTGTYLGISLQAGLHAAAEMIYRTGIATLPTTKS